MAKVYIVTSGSYSDYRIERVFLDREKADRYARTVYDSNGVSEYNTDDDEEYEEYMEVRVSYYGAPNVAEAGYYFDCDRKNTLDDEKREVSYYFESDSFDFKRIVPVSADTCALERKYHRVCEDLYAQIRSLIDIERWTPDMVSEWLADKGRYNDVMKTEVG